MNNAIVAQSGGPSSAINSTLAGVIHGCQNSKEIDKIYGAYNGIEGILKDNITDLTDFNEIENLKQTPSSALGSCRYKISDFKKNEDDYMKISEFCEKYSIKYFFYIGGNDSMDTVFKLSEYFKMKNIDVKVMGLPKTIDNDLAGTDHCPGFGSAAKYLNITLKEIYRDCSVYNTKSVTIVEAMGRNAGWLTASSCILTYLEKKAPHLIYLPEVAFDLDNFIEDLKKELETDNNILVVVSEGIKFENGSYVSENTNYQKDGFGHVQASGVCKFLESHITGRLGCKVRGIELSVLQRCSGITVSKTDILESFDLGREGVAYALQNKTGKMVGLKRVSNNPYKVEIQLVDIDEVANIEKLVPKEWINERKNGLTKEAFEYFYPLIKGSLEPLFENDLPKHIVL